MDVPRRKSGILGTIDDMWFRWVTDFGLPGPDRGPGGKYLLVGPGYEGPLPDGGFHVSHARTTRMCVIGRAFMVDNDPAPAAEAVRAASGSTPTRLERRAPQWRASWRGRAPLAGVTAAAETTFVEAVDLEMNTLPPNDFSYWKTIHELVRRSRPSGDPEILGQLAAVGIRKGQPFEPDERMRAILDEAAAVGNATARTVFIAPRESEGMAYYPGSAWVNMLFVGGYEFMTPPPEITPDGVRESPSDGARKLNARINFFHGVTGITPAMCMRLTGIGSQYVMASCDANGEFLEGDKNYRVNLPADIPESRFWSMIAYDDQTRSMLQSEQLMPGWAASRARSSRTRTARPTSTSDPRRRQEKSATGSRPSLARAGSRSCASTTRSSRSSTRAGGRARSSHE